AFARVYLIGRPAVIGCLASEKKAKELELDEAKLLPPPAAAAAVDAQSFALENGVKVISRRHPTARVSALEGFIRGGSAFLTPETQGAELLSFAIALEASKDVPKDELRRKLEGIGARVGSDANYEYSRVGVVAPSENFQDAVQLLAGCLEKPAL